MLEPWLSWCRVLMCHCRARYLESTKDKVEIILQWIQRSIVPELQGVGELISRELCSTQPFFFFPPLIAFGQASEQACKQATLNQS